MVCSRLLVLVCLGTFHQGSEASVFGWIWGKETDDTSALVADGIPLVSIPYESMTEDEKFLQEAAKFTEIQVASPLETCQHKVILKIKTSCSEMTEEQLAKLSVNLLNCQSAVEGRKMFPCTEEMSLKQCTTDMDADMWNAYHLMSNRARAVCYAARSTQFRALTELTVNKLMQTAHTQIKTLHSLKESQDKLEEQTVEALASLSKGNKILLDQQKHLNDAQASAYNLVTTNLRELNNEKALIRSGHAELAAMASEIRNKLGEASKSLEEQALAHSENHKEILQDLLNIQEQAQLIWDKIESSTNKIFDQHEEALLRYDQTLDKLEQINDTIQYIWNVTNVMRKEVDDKLNWLTNYIGDTGEQMHRVYRTGLHVIYLLFAMIIAAFLNAPLLTRIIILGIVPLNLLSYLKHGMEACLDFTSMTVLIFLITMMHFLMLGIQQIFGPKSKNLRAEPVQVINRNGHTMGRADISDSPSNPNLEASRTPKVSFYAKLHKTTMELCGFICRQLNLCIQKCKAVIKPAALLTRQSFPQHEELSCSYISSSRNRENLLHSFEREFPSMSEDMTDFEHSRMFDRRNETLEEFNNLIDANDLRLRLRKRDASVAGSSYSRQDSPTNSRVLCNAWTKKGKKCQCLALGGQNYCARHSRDNSIMSDSREFL